MTRERRTLLGLALAALLVRLSLLGWFDGIEPRIHDEGDYHSIAASLAETGEFALSGEKTSFRPPLYPGLVAAVYRVAGVGSYQAVRLAQVVLGLAVIPIVFALGRRIYDERTGLVAAALAVFYPSLWGHAYLLLTEVPFTLLLCGGTLALVAFVGSAGAFDDGSAGEGRPREASRESRGGAAGGNDRGEEPAHGTIAPAGRAPRWWLAAAAGGLFGLAALTRSTMFLYPPLLAIVVFALWPERRQRRIAAVALFVVGFGLVIGPWIARNSRLHGTLSPIDSNAGFTAAKFSPVLGGEQWPRKGAVGPGTPVEQRGAAAAPALADVGTSDPTAAPDETQAGSAREGVAEAGARRARETGRTRRSSAGVRLVRSVARNAFSFWRIDREIVGAAARGWLGPMPRGAVLALAALIGLYYVALLLAGVFGAVLRPPASRVQLAILLSVIAVIAGVHALTFGHSRYHIPVMPLVALFAARLFVTWRAPASRRRGVLAAVVAAVLVASWVTGFVSTDRVDLERHLGGDEGGVGTDGVIDTGTASGDQEDPAEGE